MRRSPKWSVWSDRLAARVGYESSRIDEGVSRFIRAARIPDEGLVNCKNEAMAHLEHSSSHLHL